MVKTKKIIYSDRYFYYHSIINSVDHGLENDNNQWIGYYYQDKSKGFHLIIKKE